MPQRSALRPRPWSRRLLPDRADLRRRPRRARADRAVPPRDGAEPLPRARRARRHRGLGQAREPPAGLQLQGARRRQPRLAALRRGTRARRRSPRRPATTASRSPSRRGSFGVRAIVCVPEGANPVKVASIRGPRRARSSSTAATSTTRASTASRSRAEHGYRYVHSGNEPHLIAGVGTHTLETLERQPDLDVLIVPIGGGSGAAGACIAAAALSPGPARDRRPVRGRAGRLPLVAGGRDRRGPDEHRRRGPRHPRRLRAPAARSCASASTDFVLVSEDEIREATRRCSSGPAT